MIKKKSLGQNFLKSQKIVEDIVLAGKVNKNDIIIEIGPGEGIMTKELLKNAKKIIAIEKDHRLIPILKEKFKNEISSKKLEIIEADILEIDPMSKSLFDIKDGYKIVANIPYYITGQIIRKFLESDYQPDSMTLLVQKEVAERIVAKDGKESLLSLSVKVFGEPKIIKKVPRGNFNPVPKVDSAILNIENISQGKIKKINGFFDVIHAGFAHKRKQVLPNLSNVFIKEKVEKALVDLDINPKARAEDLPLEIWMKLTNLLMI